MEYLEGFPSFKLTYRRRTGIDDGFSGFANSDWVIAQSVSLQQIPSTMALEAAEDNSAIDGRSGVLLGVYSGY